MVQQGNSQCSNGSFGPSPARQTSEGMLLGGEVEDGADQALQHWAEANAYRQTADVYQNYSQTVMAK